MERECISADYPLEARRREVEAVLDSTQRERSRSTRPGQPSGSDADTASASQRLGSGALLEFSVLNEVAVTQDG